jgi:hypothetical protein
MQIAFNQMRWLAVLTLLGLVLPWLAACGSDSAPTLGQRGRPTLVFIYTDG